MVLIVGETDLQMRLPLPDPHVQDRAHINSRGPVQDDVATESQVLPPVREHNLLPPPL